MCEPISTGTAIALGLAGAATVGGGIMNSNAAAANQANAVRAKNAAVAQNLLEQENLQKQSTGIFDQNLDTYKAPERTLQTAQAADTNAISANSPGEKALASGAVTSNAPKVVQDAASSSISQRLAKLRASDAALGNLTGYSSAGQAQAFGTKDAARRIGTIGGFANDAATVGGARLQADVANSQKAAGPWGDILSGIGTMGGYYAGKNLNLFGSPNTGNVVGKAQYY